MPPRAVFALALSAAAAYEQPGVPPQCFPAAQSIFSRYPSENGLAAEWTWDLRPLCAIAGAEYLSRPPATAGDQNPRIRFNICGTVSTPIAPVDETPNPDFPNGVQRLPIPHSHGVGIQVRARDTPALTASRPLTQLTNLFYAHSAPAVPRGLSAAGALDVRPHQQRLLR